MRPEREKFIRSQTVDYVENNDGEEYIGYERVNMGNAVHYAKRLQFFLVFHICLNIFIVIFTFMQPPKNFLTRQISIQQCAIVHECIYKRKLNLIQPAL